MTVYVQRLGRRIIVICFHAAAFLEPKTICEVFQSAKFSRARFRNARDSYMQFALFILICVFLRAKRTKARICRVMLIYA